MFQWLESFPWGFNRSDRSTWIDQHLPEHIKGGMCHAYNVQNEKFMWEARSEPRVIDAFAKLRGTDKLLVSFDGMNFVLPCGTPLLQSQPWPHIDQNGGLLVMKGSTKLMPEFFKTHAGTMDRLTWGLMQWFENRGCEIQKVNAEAGDLILWDYGTIYFTCIPTSQNTRAVIYACCTPLTIYNTDWPHDNLFTETSLAKLPIKDAGVLTRLFEEPLKTELVLRLVGKLPY
ncbi:hypothetical protein BDV24DRAFT_146825 [Aspergillus arachidicola]|uniref:Uncharacterized protein n=1 Tax=Aspergillus arachidicola TaxID=656916 RepID=A0A5N6YPF5_9EURO|nr:hypothetical protein BDV24DRAFT_146825 [Aspergillus arachidicola]